jgi:lipoyl synthase
MNPVRAFISDALDRSSNGMNTTPQWLRKTIIVNDAFFETKKALSDFSVNTVCESSLCPNLNECFSRKRATFMILGKACTRPCAFCSVTGGKTEPRDILEAERIAGCVKELGLKYIIVTSVARDDLADGGASQFVSVVECIRSALKDVHIELLIPDFRVMESSIRAVVNSGADVIGHNIETVRRLHPVLRPGAAYSGSLAVLKKIKKFSSAQLVKSSIMVGLGEAEGEVIEAMEDLRGAGCDILTIGQYLRPGKDNYPVQRFVTPEEFVRYKKAGQRMGFKRIRSGPFVRSSYFAEEDWTEILNTTAV